jgi:hypothetical protein
MGNWQWRTRIGDADDEQLLEHFADDDGQLASGGRVRVGSHQQAAARESGGLSNRSA